MKQDYQQEVNRLFSILRDTPITDTARRQEITETIDYLQTRIKTFA